ncbi:MAG: hypothetical protein L3V56_07625 [Candidatus Magnetoovum sp. WYHC-5]|nr:hypothetical protein [Candidatus Magnetoovum sp. WYHC-5]
MSKLKEEFNIDLNALFGGVLKSYEYRKEQEDMVHAIILALLNERHLIVEAGTGVGKSFAYLMGAIFWLWEDKKRKLAISTYTKALQSQLYEKDLPFLKNNLFPELSYALCLGSENYVCLRKLYAVNHEHLFDDFDVAEYSMVLSWAKATQKGIRSEISVKNELWQQVCRETDLCYGKRCRFFKDCFYQMARFSANKAQILVTNHHLFFTNISSGYKALPQFSTVILDEAHAIEDVASDYLSFQVSNYQVKRLLDSIYTVRGKGLLNKIRVTDELGFYRKNIIFAVNDLRQREESFFREVLNRLTDNSPLRIHESGFVDDTLSTFLNELTTHLHKFAKLCENKDDSFEINTIADRCSAIVSNLKVILQMSMTDIVYFAEKANKTVRLVATPINIADMLKSTVFDVYKTCVMTSATLSTDEQFNYFRQRIGADNSDELLLKSPFDYKHQALLYISTNTKLPSDNEYFNIIVEEIYDIASIHKGKTLVLFTSYSLMNGVFEVLSKRLTIYKQGDMDSYSLIEQFRRSNGALLFGTKTFWQGVDFPGDELSCVIITRLPFDVPTDPVMEGKIEFIQKQGGEPFNDYQVPRAVITFKQGFGRLIRTKNDYGVVAVLDSRVLYKRYGKSFLKSLPPAKITKNLNEVMTFFKNKLPLC